MIAIRAGTLVDGNGNAPIQDAVILIDGERIKQVGPAAQVQIPPDAEVIDASGKTVLPGLIDVHVHVHSLGGSDGNFFVWEASGSQAQLALRAVAYVQRDLKMGYTTLCNLASPTYVDVALRDAIDQGLVVGPRLRAAGQGLTITGGHMDQAFFMPEVKIPGRTGICDGPWEGRRAVRTQCKFGADTIKINACSSGVGTYTVAPPWMFEMTFEEISAICDEAHRLGRRVAAHTSGGQGITDSILGGVDSLEHAHWLTDEQLDLMAEHGTFYVPTLIVNSRAVAGGKDQPGLSPTSWEWLMKADEGKWDSLARAKKAGVKIATGSDAGFLIYHGEGACEIEELVRGGFTPLEAIGAATKMAAECLRMEKQVGTLDAGKFADVVIVDGDPLQNIKILQDQKKIVGVYKGGQLVA